MSSMERLQNLLAGASELPPAQRAAYLDAACQGDAALRAEVESLLQSHDDAARFLADPTAIAPAPVTLHDSTLVTPISEHPGQMIGRYKLRQQIGEGGFGVVYMAEQEQPVRRKVALKIIKLGMDTKQVIARFEAERQALAMMDHPNIAKVLDASATDTGRPYFVMELVKGVPITEYCDRQNLSVGERLELFKQTCNAVQHAHQKGIIHRDIKPSNVMITLHDGKPVPKVIDFGIAKATNHRLTEKTVFTEYRQFIGTPEYMSPEQAEMSGMDIDTRSDVYSLGVLLYELLTGTTPFNGPSLRSGGYAEIQRIIREDTPHKPSARLSTLDTLPSIAAHRHTEPKKLGLLVRGDLDWIVMKAMEKDRTRRYETGNGFAADIQRYLDNEPVVASPPSTAYRMRKFVRRNRASVTAATLIAAMLVLGVAGTTWGMVWAFSEKDRADEAATNAMRAARAEQIARRDAENAEEIATERAEGERIAKEHAERRLSQLAKGNGILASIFASLDPKVIARAERPLSAVLVENLGRAAKQLEGEAIGDPLLVAQMQVTLGTSLIGLGVAEQAIPLLVNSLETRHARLGADHPLTLASMHGLVNAYWEVGDQDRALPLAEETLERHRALFGPGHPATFSTMNTLASVFTYMGQFDKSIPMFEELLTLQTAQLGRDHPDTTAAILNLGMNYKEVGRLDEATPLLEEAVSVSRGSRGLAHPETLICMTNLAQAYHNADRLDLALPLYEETIQHANAALGPDHPHTRKTVNSLATAYWTAGLFTKSVPLYEENFERLQSQLGLDHPATLEGAANLGANYLHAGRRDEARTLLEETLEQSKTVLGPEHLTTLLCIGNLSSVYIDTGRFDLVVPLLEDALPAMNAILGVAHTNTIQMMNYLGVAYWHQGRLDKSVPIFEEILPLHAATLGRNHPQTRQIVANLIVNYGDAGRHAETIPLLEETFNYMRSTHGADHPETIMSLGNVAVAYWRVAQLDKSIPVFEQTLRLAEAKFGRSHWSTLQTAANLGVNYKDAGRLAEAIPLLDEAYQASKREPSLAWVGVELLDASARAADPSNPEGNSWVVALTHELLAAARIALPANSPELAVQLAVFGQSLLRVKEWDEAEPLIREALIIREAKEPDDWRTFNTKSMLGGALQGQNKLAEAEPLLLDGYQGMKEREATIPQLPQAQARIPDALKRIVDLYTVWHQAEPNAGYDAKAAEWRAMLSDSDDGDE